MLGCSDRHRRSRVVKPSRSRDKPVHRSRTPEDDFDQADAAPEAPLTLEERARLLVELEAELEAAERSVEEEGTISADELLKRRAEYWAVPTRGPSERNGKPPRRRPR
jgi:hypothetical protein